MLISTLNYRSVANLWPLHMSATWLLVFLTFIRTGPFGLNNGTSNFSWIGLPLGLSLQPSELAKISFIITFALHLSNVRNNINNPKTLFFVLMHMLAPAAVIHFQGDDGTALIFLFIGIIMLFVAGLSYKYILSVLGVALISSLFFGNYVWNNIISQYQRSRILGVFFPENPEYKTVLYQQNMASIAIGSGGLTGKGFLQDEHHYVPVNQNDFLFSYIAESAGFIGSCMVLFLLLFLIIKTFATALRSKDKLGSLICTGVASVFIIQMVLNIGMNLTLLPVIGITLPFFSSGGTSVTMLYLSIGVVLSVYRFNVDSLFDKK